jgi:hypothetical protein
MREFSKTKGHKKTVNLSQKSRFFYGGQFLSKSAAIFAIFDVFSPELQYI